VAQKRTKRESRRRPPPTSKLREGPRHNIAAEDEQHGEDITWMCPLFGELLGGDARVEGGGAREKLCQEGWHDVNHRVSFKAKISQHIAEVSFN
jgi:hypothetical protein